MSEDDSLYPAPPHAVGPEKSVLSSCLQDPVIFIGTAVEMGMTPEHFYLPSHSELFSFLLGMFERGEAIELVSLVQKLIDGGKLDRVGGPATLTDIYTYSPSGGHFRAHADHLRDKFTLRQVLQLCNAGVAAVYDSPDEVDPLLDSIEAGMTNVRGCRDGKKTGSTKDAVDTVIQRIADQVSGKKAVSGLPTGFSELDRLCGGLKPGEVFVVAARPSMGKTSFMMNIVENTVFDRAGAAGVFSCEMSRDQLIERLIHSRAKFDAGIFRKGEKPTQEDLRRLREAAHEIKCASNRLPIDDTPGISINQLRAVARRMKRESDIQLLGIDYVQLLKSNSKQAANNREREVAEISGGIKGLAKELGIPIILLAQLNRKAEDRSSGSGKKKIGVPRMSDLRESGSIEQDADMVGLLYREEYYLDGENAEAVAGEAELFLPKNRSGDTGEVCLTFIKEFTKFEQRQWRPRPTNPKKPEVDF